MRSKSFMVTILPGIGTFVGVAFVALLGALLWPKDGPYYNYWPVEHTIAKAIDVLERAVHQLPAEEQGSVSRILAKLQSMTYDDLLVLSLSSDVCQQIGCQGARPDTVRRFVERYLNIRIAEDNHATAMQANDTAWGSYETAEQSKWIALVGTAVNTAISFVTLLVSIFHKPKPTTPPAPPTWS